MIERGYKISQLGPVETVQGPMEIEVLDSSEIDLEKRNKRLSLDKLRDYLGTGVPIPPEGVSWVAAPDITVSGTSVTFHNAAQASWGVENVVYPTGEMITGIPLAGLNLTRFDAVVAYQDATYARISGPESLNPAFPVLPADALFVSYLYVTDAAVSRHGLSDDVRYVNNQLQKADGTPIPFPDGGDKLATGTQIDFTVDVNGAKVPFVKDNTIAGGKLTLLDRAEALLNPRKSPSGNTIYQVPSLYTGKTFSANKVTTKPGGGAYTDTDLNEYIVKSGTEYFKISLPKLDVREFGATGDGSTDDSAAIKRALDTAKLYGVPEVHLPKGTYVIYAAAGLDLHSHLTLTGEGAESILHMAGGVSWLLSANKGSGGTTNTADNMRHILISGIHFKCTVGTFAEHTHLLNLNAVSHVLVEKCFFTGFQGDGIYLGSSNTAGTERHNEDITIRNCRFDGVNKQNRNAVSVVDGVRVKIHHNHFVNTTAPNMPGAVNIEPDSYTFHRVYDVSVHDNSFENIGGNVAAVAVVCNGLATTLQQKVAVYNNTFKNCNIPFYAQFGNPTETSVSNDVQFFRNTAQNCTAPFHLMKVKGVEISHNKFQEISGAAIIGYDGADSNAAQIKVRHNLFDRCGVSASQFFALFRCWDFQFEENEVRDCTNGVDGTNYLLQFMPGVTMVEGVKIRKNKVYRTDAGFQYFTVDSAGKTTIAKNVFEDNAFDPVVTPVGTMPYYLKKGSTSQRPVNPPSGWNYYDTTAVKELVWTGTEWKAGTYGEDLPVAATNTETRLGTDNTKYVTPLEAKNLYRPVYTVINGSQAVSPGATPRVFEANTAGGPITLTWLEDSSVQLGTMMELRNNQGNPLTITPAEGVLINSSAASIILKHRGDYMRMVATGIATWRVLFVVQRQLPEATTGETIQFDRARDYGFPNPIANLGIELTGAQVNTMVTVFMTGQSARPAALNALNPDNTPRYKIDPRNEPVYDPAKELLITLRYLSDTKILVTFLQY